MTDVPLKIQVGGGGAATSSGILFEQQLGSLFGAWLLAGQPFDGRLALGDAQPLWLRFETDAPVDDILVATTMDGFVAVQAKTTASLSRDSNSPFGKTIAQFVRQWLACRDGDGQRHWNRPLDPVRDRLVLAVGREAPATVRVDLAAALRLRSQPGAGVLTESQTRAFADFEHCVRQAWASATSEAFDPNLPDNLARLIRVFTFDPSGSDHLAATTALSLCIPESADPNVALSGLQAVSADMMAGRGGADLATLRQSLLVRGVKLAGPPRYRADIECLQEYSRVTAVSLARYEVIEAVEGEPKSVERDCQTPILNAALAGSMLIVGEPGAGKSGVLNALARDLRALGNDVVELAIDRFSVESLEGLRDDLKLDHALLDVLDNWDGPPAWLVIDALDATRGGRGEGVFRTLIQEVLARSGRWRVVASIRTFDLRMGQQFRALFKGTPPVPSLQEEGFTAVRHVKVPEWSPDEFKQLLEKVPALSAALANASPALSELAMVPFNTRLLSELIKDGLVTVDYSHVASQAELLQLYWDHRVGEHGTAARACIRRIAEAMVAARALRAPIDVAAGSDPAMIDTLAQEGVIIGVDNDRWIQFRHHLLFDFAAARVLLDPATLVDGSYRFAKQDARGLMLAPALGFVLTEIWKRDARRADFWTATAIILGDQSSDPVIRSATGRLCAEYPAVPLDTAVLAERVVAGDERAAQAFLHTGGALFIRLEDHPTMSLAPWLGLLRAIAPNVAPVAGTVRFLLYRLSETVTDPDGRADLGHAARALLTYAFSLPHSGNLTSSAIDLVAGTIDTDPAQSQRLLARIFEPDRLDAYGAEEVPTLTRRIESIANADAAFAVEIYRQTYAYTVTEERVTRMGNSQILSLTSNARQDYEMARYSLGEFIKAFLENRPDEAVSSIIEAVEGYVTREHPLTCERLDQRLVVEGRSVRLREDWSHIWAHDPDSTNAQDADGLIKHLLEFLRTADAVAARHTFKQFLDKASLAIFWSRLFLVAAERDDGLIELMLPFAMEEAFLMLPDTRKDAVDVVAKGYARLAPERREAFERSIDAFDFSKFLRPDEARESFKRRLFGAVSPSALVTDDAVAIGQAAPEDDDERNDRLFVVRSGWRGTEEFHWIGGLDREAPANKVLMDAIGRTNETVGFESASNDGSNVSFETAVASLNDLAAAIDREAQNALLIINAEGIIGQGVGRIVDQKRGPPVTDPDATAVLLRLLRIASTSEGPTVDDDTEAAFERNASWDSPAPRVEAAQTVLDLSFERPDLHASLGPDIEALLADPHPAVRLQVGVRLTRIWELDREGFWRRLSQRLADEENQGVLDHIISGALGRVIHEDPKRTEQLFLDLLQRYPGNEERQARMRRAVADKVAILWITHQREAARAVIDSWVADPTKHHAELSTILSTMRNAFVMGLGNHEKREGRDEGLRHRAQAFAMAIVTAANEQMIGYPDLPDPSPEKLAAWKKSSQLLDSACRELYFASGARNERSESVRPIDDDDLAIFFAETAPILERIGDSATPHTIYYLLQLLEFLLPIDPQKSFDLTAHALRGGGKRTGYQFESLGADLLVRLVGVFLADYKEVFESDERRAALIECLEIFMEAGWPAARRLLYRLPELIQ